MAVLSQVSILRVFITNSKVVFMTRCPHANSMRVLEYCPVYDGALKPALDVDKVHRSIKLSYMLGNASQKTSTNLCTSCEAVRFSFFFYNFLKKDFIEYYGKVILT